MSSTIAVIAHFWGMPPTFAIIYIYTHTHIYILQLNYVKSKYIIYNMDMFFDYLCKR